MTDRKGVKLSILNKLSIIIDSHATDIRYMKLLTAKQGYGFDEERYKQAEFERNITLENSSYEGYMIPIIFHPDIWEYGWE